MAGPAGRYPFRFACRRSGNCCARPGGVVSVTAAEIAVIAAHLGMDAAAVRSRFVDPRGDRLKDGLGGRCVFLADGGQAACTIYPARPERCRTWPFWPELADSAAALAAARRCCPGIEG